MDPVAVAGEVERQLAEAGSPERASKEKAYLRSDLRFLGASVPEVRREAAQLRRAHRDLDHDAVVALVSALWERKVHECRLAAVVLLDLYADRLGAGDLPLLQQLLHEAKTWALVDVLCTSVVAAVIQRCPSAVEVLDEWSRDEDFWLRRAALLSLLPALRRGDGDLSRLSRYADAMLDEKEFFIRKAIGWVLRDTGRKNPAFVVDWLAPRTDRASGVTVREAVKYVPPADRERLLSAYRRGVAAA